MGSSGKPCFKKGLSVCPSKFSILYLQIATRHEGLSLWYWVILRRRIRNGQLQSAKRHCVYLCIFVTIRFHGSSLSVINQVPPCMLGEEDKHPWIATKGGMPIPATIPVDQ